MTAAVIWIALPGLFGVLIGAGRNRHPWSSGAGVLVAGILAVLGLFLTVDEPVAFGSIEILIRSEHILLGRSLVIGQAAQRIVGAAYGAVALWGIGGWLLGVNRFFIPSGLLATAFLCAALAVLPWQFAGIFILLAVLTLVPLLAPPGSAPAAGVLKFVAFQAIGVPFLIIAGTLMEGLESIPAGLSLALRPGIFLGFSFIFLLAVFPFHGWVPGLAENYDPLPVGFILVLLPGFIGVFGLQLIDRYVFLRTSVEFFTLVRTVGILSVLAGSAWVIVQRHAGRVLGFTALIETGLLLLAVGAGPAIGAGLFFPVIAARSGGFLIWSAGLSGMLRNGRTLDFAGLRSALHAHPIPSAAVLAGVFSTAGFPLLAGYPAKLHLAAALAEIDPTAVFAVWLGMAGTAAAGFRILATMIAPVEQPSKPVQDANAPAPEPGELPGLKPGPGSQPSVPAFLLAAGCLLLLFFGLFPGWIAWLAATMTPAFDHLAR